MRCPIVLALVLMSVPLSARADVTVFYAEPPRTRPLVAVPAPEPTAPASTRPRGRASTPITPTAAAPLVATPIAHPTPAPSPPTATPQVASPATPPPATPPPATPSPATPPSTAAVSASETTAPAASLRASGCQTPAPVRFVRATDGSREHRLLHLTDCHGAPDQESLRELSILARPRTAERPTARDLAAHAADPDFYAADIRRLDEGLLTRLQRIADRFPGHDIELTSGYRPDARESSRHRTGHALDLRVVGASLEEVHALALSFDESGVGLYPTSEFLHVDVRPRVTRWVDLAGPGEPANMVEVVTARDGHAHGAPALRWPASGGADVPVVPTAGAAPARRATVRSEDDHRAALREALEALEALEGLDLPGQ